MKLIFQYLKPHKKVLFFTLFLAALNQIFSLLDPYLYRLMLDDYVLKVGELEQSVFVSGILWLMAASVGTAFVSRVAKSFQDYFANSMTQKMGTKMYADSVGHSFELPYATFEDQRSGQVLETLRKARDDSQQLIQGLINTVFLSLVGILFVVVYAFIVHPWIGTGYFMLIPILAGLNMFISRKIKDIQKDIVAQMTDLSGSTTETLRNVELVKSLGLESQEVNRLNKVNDQILQLELTKIRLVRKLLFVQGTTINAVRTLLIFLMFWLIYQQAISVGEYFSLFAYSFFIFAPLSDLGNVITKYYEAKASTEQLAEVLKMEPEPKSENVKTIAALENISFDEVGFEYGGAKISALNNLSLEIKAGETVAFVGPSGSGKSTTVKILSGLYKPTTGSLRINNEDSKNINYDALKLRLGLVAQETQLFAGTIRENLLFVRPQATDDECREVLRQAAADSVLKRAEKGLDTRIGEGGLKLSGGERQRLAIARALLRKPDIIIFDEATSSLDSLTEQAITETIKDIGQKNPHLMMIIVAHRLSTIVHVDRIYVFENGQIIEVGNHNQLLKNDGLYHALWRQQTGSND